MTDILTAVQGVQAAVDALSAKLDAHMATTTTVDLTGVLAAIADLKADVSAVRALEAPAA